MVEVRPLGLDGVVEIRPPRFGDDRGFFSETYSAPALAGAGIDIAFVQDNHSFSAARFVLRGLHYQLPPSAQDKLVRVTRGSVYDAVVDIRRGSPTFGRWVGLVLSAELWNQILVPKGFAHGFVTLEEGCEVQYKVSAPYDRAADRAIRFDDPAIGIDWPIERDLLTLSPKDEAAPRMADTEIPDSWS
ncbi:MAG TPA: dTDP-4-dehydrorhamnose 3,5-epimerase [Allosphingosinicella sp.]|jgi:dTDP-4-dehydrorhamnose 3,5-epimerase